MQSRLLKVLDDLPLAPSPVVRLKQRKSDAQSTFTYMDLFAGIGGFHLALGAQGGRAVFASEWDTAARITYALNHGVVPFGDIREFTRDRSGRSRGSNRIVSRLPVADIIAAGFPCQPFSKAGVSSRNHHGLEHGLNCTSQGTLFEDILLIAKALKPKALLLENVANLASHDSGNTLRVIRSEIREAGYTLFPEWSNTKKGWAVVDSRAVVAHRRRRVYMVCVRNEIATKLGEFQMPTFANGNFSLRDLIDEDNDYTPAEKFDLFSISSRMWTSHKRREDSHKEKNNGFRIGLMTDLSQPAPTLVARYYKDGKDCLIPHTDPRRPPRMLTPRECALLQTFPKRFRLPSVASHAYRQFGNAITVEIARAISAALVSYLDREAHTTE